MTYTTLQKEILNEFMPVIQSADFGKNSEEKFRLSLCIGLFAGKVVSLEKASELSGKSISQFVDILISKNIPWNEYTQEHFIQDESAIKKYLQDREE